MSGKRTEAVAQDREQFAKRVVEHFGGEPTGAHAIGSPPKKGGIHVSVEFEGELDDDYDDEAYVEENKAGIIERFNEGEAEVWVDTEEPDEKASKDEDNLNNPMRFAIRNRTIDVGEKLRHPDFKEKQVTDLEIQDGQLYVHWEWVDPPEEDPTG